MPHLLAMHCIHAVQSLLGVFLKQRQPRAVEKSTFFDDWKIFLFYLLNFVRHGGHPRIQYCTLLYRTGDSVPGEDRPAQYDAYVLSIG